MNLKDLKNWMWIEVCEGDDRIEMSEEYLDLIKDIGDEEVGGSLFIYYFYLILDRLVEKEMIEFEGGDFDWIYEFLKEYNEENNFNKYMDEYNFNWTKIKEMMELINSKLK
jgi:hypothetical protein